MQKIQVTLYPQIKLFWLHVTLSSFHKEQGLASIAVYSYLYVSMVGRCTSELGESTLISLMVRKKISFFFKNAVPGILRHQ